MPRFAADLSLMFTEVEPIARIQAALDAGFEAVEMQFVYDLPLAEMERETVRTGVTWNILNIAVGAGVTMGPLVAAAPGMKAEFRANLEAAVAYAEATRPENFVIPAYRPPDGVDRTEALAAFKENLWDAAERFQELGIRTLIEPLNPDFRPQSLLTTSAGAVAVIAEVGHPNLGLEYDIFHMAVTEGDLIANIEKHLPLIGNIQFADVPGRGEPGSGDIDFPGLFAALDAMGYEHWTAAEYVPTGPTLETLGWMGD